MVHKKIDFEFDIGNERITVQMVSFLQNQLYEKIQVLHLQAEYMYEKGVPLSEFYDNQITLC